MTDQMTDFERGARAAVEAFDLYLRNEDEVIVTGTIYSTRDDGRVTKDDPGEWQRHTDEEVEGWAKGAVHDVMCDERRRLANARPQSDGSGPELDYAEMHGDDFDAPEPDGSGSERG